MRNNVFKRHLALFVALVFVLTSIPMSSVFAASNDGKIELNGNFFYDDDTSATSPKNLTLTLTASAINDKAPIALVISGPAVKFRLIKDDVTSGSHISVYPNVSPFSDKATASAMIGIVPGQSASVNDSVEIVASQGGIIYALGKFTVQERSGGGGGGGGGGGTPAVPKTDDEKKGGSADSWADNPFYDIKPTDWFYSDVEFVVKNGLFQGVSADSFSPGSPMTRGMIVTVLGRLYGADENAYANSSFSDVSAGQYYTAYVEWAKANGIVNGVGDNLFAPNSNVSRQDFAVLLLRYADFAQKQFPTTRQFSTFADDTEIAAYARNAIQTLYNGGIINGIGGNAINPKGNATRAEVAAMLHRFIDASGGIEAHKAPADETADAAKTEEPAAGTGAEKTETGTDANKAADADKSTSGTETDKAGAGGTK